MNEIRRSPVHELGYNFIEPQFLPKGMDEYYIRNRQNTNGIQYRRLTASEIEALVRNRNTSDDWSGILVSDAFNPELVQDCKFFGLVRIGKLEPYYLEFHNLRRPVGLYNSTIISCDFGDNVVIDNVNYLSHYIIGSDVIIVNVNEIAATGAARFGNGILKQGEGESRRMWMEVCNENGGRSILPFDGMQPGDAYLWTRFRENTLFQEKLIQFTDKRFDQHRGYYGTIGDRSVIKNCKILKDVLVGTDAYIKGANKIKNVTINSSAEASSQIGEGCELVNGIVDYGCRIFYGVKAVKFFLASHSQLKYGARLINSYLGNNSTISCCEVLNSLIFPAHEQHHNNSFLCAALVGGQSNMAAGATIGSNHNSRSPDGELVAGRGFWPGLCVSLKHNSKFASFTILAKGDYPHELQIPIPFSLVSNDAAKDELVVMPGFWFMYNMYALARNSRKYKDRDKRHRIIQPIETDFLAPDTLHELRFAIEWLELAAGHQLAGVARKKTAECRAAGRAALQEAYTQGNTIELMATGFEHSKRTVRVIKAAEAWHIFNELVVFHAAEQLMELMQQEKADSLRKLRSLLPATTTVQEWENAGGQLIPREHFLRLVNGISKGRIRSWEAVHQFYQTEREQYARAKCANALAALAERKGKKLQALTPTEWQEVFEQALAVKTWMTAGIRQSRAKDYQNAFRKMVYNSDAEMQKVMGRLNSNAFIKEEEAALEQFSKKVRRIQQLLRK